MHCVAERSALSDHQGGMCYSQLLVCGVRASGGNIQCILATPTLHSLA